MNRLLQNANLIRRRGVRELSKKQLLKANLELTKKRAWKGGYFNVDSHSCFFERLVLGQDFLSLFCHAVLSILQAASPIQLNLH